MSERAQKAWLVGDSNWATEMARGPTAFQGVHCSPAALPCAATLLAWPQRAHTLHPPSAAPPWPSPPVPLRPSTHAGLVVNVPVLGQLGGVDLEDLHARLHAGGAGKGWLCFALQHMCNFTLSVTPE